MLRATTCVEAAKKRFRHPTRNLLDENDICQHMNADNAAPINQAAPNRDYLLLLHAGIKGHGSASFKGAEDFKELPHRQILEVHHVLINCPTAEVLAHAPAKLATSVALAPALHLGPFKYSYTGH